MSQLFQFNVELTNLFPLAVAPILQDGIHGILSLARNLKKSGSDLVVENDLASIFGRGRIEPRLLSHFKEEVIKSVRITPLHPDSELQLQYGPAATLNHAIQSSDRAYLASVIQLSMLCAFHNRIELASALSECMSKRFHLGRPGANLDSGFDPVENTLHAISAQTDAYPWNRHLEQVESMLQEADTKGQYWPRERAIMLELPPSTLLSAMDMLYMVQSLPESRKMFVNCRRGLLILILWAHHLLSLNVTIEGFGDESVTFGNHLTAQVIIKWGPDFIPDEDDTEVLLLDSNAEILLQVRPESLSLTSIASDERHAIRGFGTHFLRRFCNSKISVPDTDPLYGCIVSYTIAMACHISQRVRRYSSGKIRITKRIDPNERPPSMIDRGNLISAAKLIFEGIEVDAKGVNDSSSRGENSGPLAEFPKPQLFQDYCSNNRLSLLDIHQLGHLAFFIVLIGVLANMKDASEAPLTVDLCNIQGGLTRWLWTQKNDVDGGKVLHHLAFFECFACLLTGNCWEEGLGADTFLISAHGWSLVMDVVGDKDPADVNVLRLHLKRGVPTSSINGERKYLVRDMEPYLVNAVPPRQAIFDRKKDRFKPRCVTHVQQRMEFVTSRSRAFLIKLQFNAQEHFEPGIVRIMPLGRGGARAVLPSLPCEYGAIFTITSRGYRRMHNALWKMVPSRACQHSKTREHARLGDEVVTTNSLDWGAEGLRQSSPEVAERVCVLLVAGDRRARWLAVQEAALNKRRKVLLRSGRTCVDCAIDQAVASHGKWLVII